MLLAKSTLSDNPLPVKQETGPKAILRSLQIYSICDEQENLSSVFFEISLFLGLFTNAFRYFYVYHLNLRCPRASNNRTL